MKAIVLKSTPLLMLCVAIEIMGGSILNSASGALFLLFPVINGVAGNIGSVLGARLSSGIHVGTIEIKRENDTFIQNVKGAILVGMSIFALLSIIIAIAYHFLAAVTPQGSFRIFLWILASGVITTVGVTGVAIGCSGLSVRYKLDPDDVVIPLVTTLGDFLGISTLLGIAILLNIGSSMGI